MLRRLAPFALLAIACNPAPAGSTPTSPVGAIPLAAADADPAADEPETAPEPETPPLARESSEPRIAPEPEEPPASEPTLEAPASGKVATALPKPLFKNVKASCGRDAGVGTKLKSFRLKDLEGKEVTNGRYRKRVMLVNFWGTWCAPCLKELPEFDRLYRRYRKAGMTLVAIATDEDAEPVKQLVAKRKLRAKVLIGGETYAGQYGAPNFPFTYVVDTTGTIVGSYHGYKEDCMGKLEDDIRKALDKR